MQDKYYYVEQVHDKNFVEIFKPHIPNFRMKKEDENIERICLGTSILSCLNAASFSCQNNETACVYRLYTFEASDIELKNFIDSIELFELGLVPDAFITNEVWVINQELEPSNISYFELGYYDLENIPILNTIEEYNEFYKNGIENTYDKECYSHIKDISVHFIDELDICNTVSLEIKLKSDDVLDKETLDFLIGTIEDEIDSIIPNAMYIEIYESFCDENECSLILTNHGFHSPFSLSKFERELNAIWDCKDFEINIIGG